MYYTKEIEDLAIELIKRASRRGVNEDDKIIMLEAMEMLLKLRRVIRKLDSELRGPHYDEKGVWVDGAAKGRKDDSQ